MSFSLPYWFLIPVLAIGAWLAYRLYFSSPALSRRWRWTLGVLTVLAWCVVAGLLIQPLWTRTFSTYHAPALVLAVDESPGYASGAAVHSESALRKSVEEAKKHYQEKGFKIVELRFSEREALRRTLDSMAVPNLQGVFLWTDGRVNKEGESQARAWSAPVFPVVVPGKSTEVQGESVEADFSNPDSGVEIAAEWRVLGRGRIAASLELRSGSQTLWKEALPSSNAPPGTKLRHRFHVAANLLRGKGDRLTALIRPDRKADNETGKNDTVEVGVLGLHRKRQVFVRPLRSLEERGLVDALFAADSMAVQVVPPESLEAAQRGGAVLWAHAPAPQAAAKKSAAPVVAYVLSTDAVSGGTLSFTSTARVVWLQDAARFFPGEVLRLADLGVSNVELPRAGISGEPVAWAEENGRRGALLSRDGKPPGSRYHFTVPPIWASGFRTGSDDRIRRLQQRWVQGVAEYVRAQAGKGEIDAAPVVRDPMDVELSRLGVDEETLAALAMTTHGALLRAAEQGSFAAALPDLPQGQSRETNSQTHPLFPLVTASWIAAGLLCAAWALRKKLHLD